MSSQWRPIIAFFVLTFVLLGLVPLTEAVLFRGGGSLDEAANRASESTGVAWTSNLVSVIRLAIAEPTLWGLLLGSAVPALAALVVCLAGGPKELRALATRFIPIRAGTPVGSALGAYATISVLMPLGLMVVYALRQALPGPAYAQPAALLGPSIFAAIFMAAFLDQGGVLEEIGWRGYATPKLQNGLMTPLHADILVGLMWGLWHIPRDVVMGVITRLGVVQYLLLFLPSFILGTVTTSIIAVYFMNRTGGSIWPGIMVHGLGNDAVGISGLATIEQALTPYHQFTKAAPFIIVAVTIIIWSGKELGRRPSMVDEL